MSDPARLSAQALAGLFARGALSPIEALAAVEARIARLNPQLNALIAEDAAGARRSPRSSRADQAVPRQRRFCAILLLRRH